MCHRLNLLSLLPEDFPDIRQLRIQNVKLQRMLSEWTAKISTGKAIGGGSLKKAEKKQASHAIRIGHQINKVNTLADKSFKEWFRRAGTLTNKQFQTWKRKFNASLTADGKRMQKQISSGMTDRLF